jgi:hypothetical protein
LSLCPRMRFLGCGISSQKIGGIAAQHSSASAPPKSSPTSLSWCLTHRLDGNTFSGSIRGRKETHAYGISYFRHSSLSRSLANQMSYPVSHCGNLTSQCEKSAVQHTLPGLLVFGVLLMAAVLAARTITADHGAGGVFEESTVGNCTTTTTSSSTSTAEPYPEPEREVVDEQPDPEPLVQLARMEAEEQARMEAEDLDYYGHDAENRSLLYSTSFTPSRRRAKKRRLESSSSGSSPPSGSGISTTMTTTSCSIVG